MHVILLLLRAKHKGGMGRERIRPRGEGPAKAGKRLKNAVLLPGIGQMNS
jgi:hypothetical protein